MKQACEVQAGHQVDQSTIYPLLNRYGWHKLVPYPRHPQASQEEEERFETILRCRLRRQSQRGKLQISALGAQDRQQTSHGYQRVADLQVSATDPDATLMLTKNGADLPGVDQV